MMTATFEADVKFGQGSKAIINWTAFVAAWPDRGVEWATQRARQAGVAAGLQLVYLKLHQPRCGRRV